LQQGLRLGVRASRQQRLHVQQADVALSAQIVARTEQCFGLLRLSDRWGDVTLQQFQLREVAAADGGFFRHLQLFRARQRLREQLARFTPASTGGGEQAEVLLHADAAGVFAQSVIRIGRLLPVGLRVVVVAELEVGEADVVQRIRGAVRILGLAPAL
jgi:hypothetical protein